MIFQPLRRLTLAVAEFRAIYPDAPLLSFHVFLTIALNQGIKTQDLVSMLGTSQSTIGRHQQLLSTWTWQDKKAGLDLIVVIPNPDDRRGRLSYLTVKGRMMACSLLRICDPESEVALADFIVPQPQTDGANEMNST
jgi:DNA-binding MarR family transcriptional regulator